MGQVLELSDKDFVKQVKLSEKPVVLTAFTAQWGEGCDKIRPMLEELADEFDYVKFCIVDVDQAQKVAARYGVLTVPTYIVFHQANIVNLEPTALTKDDIRNMIL